ncbi:MAG: RIP metalloprotease RseP [bacterium]|nr:RIP metalloprotease RseP [bacterium]
MLDFLLGNDAILTIFAFLLVLIPAVFIHELGHFLAAKMVGITILEFGIGMPPRAVKLFTHKGTDYTLNWLPLGGFVRPLGEDIVRPVGDEAMLSDRQEAIGRGIANPKSVNEAKPLGRIFFMAGGALANFLTAFVLFVVIGIFGLPAVTAMPFETPSGALAQAGVQPGDSIIAVDGQTLDNANEFLERLYATPGEPTTITVRRDGQTLDLTLTLFGTLDESTLAARPIILGAADDSPAAEAGLQANDIAIAFNGEPLDSYETLQRLTRENLGREVTLTVWRDGETFDVSLTPRENPPQGQGALGIQISDAGVDTALGLVLLPDYVGRPLAQAIPYSFERMGAVVSAIASIPSQLINGTASGEDMRLASPLGISQVGGVLVEESIEQNRPGIILEYMALISFALGLTNLLPIPALDGGRILFVLIEILRGRPIAPEREGMVHLVGMVVLLSLMFVVLINDAINPLSNLLP